MANFRIIEDNEDISSFDMPLGRTLEFLQWGGDSSGNKLDVTLGASSTILDIDVSPRKLPAASTAFKLTAKTSGGPVTVHGYVKGTTQPYSSDLSVRVRGTPQKQPTYSVDLLSDLAAKGNAKQVLAYTHILTGPCDNTNILSQNTEEGHYNCGDVAASYGKKFFTKETHTAYFGYYLPPTSDKMADLRFDEMKIRSAITKIKGYLDKAEPVRLWMIHHDGFKPFIQGDWRTHFLTMIGYGANKFLYIDPWPSGSKLEYDGGVYSKRLNCFLGELVYDMANLKLGIGSPTTKKGLHDYKVIAGP